jgi:hypothetical protein
MRTHALVMLALAGCSDDGGGTRSDASTVDEARPVDAAVDARPPNTTHRGLVQAVRIGANTSPTSIGFYDVPTTATGCTWMYSGGCSMQNCPAGAGLVAASAGNVTVTVGTTPTTVSPTGAMYPPATPSPITPGTTVQMAAAGATVPAFTSMTLTTPEPLTVTAPADNAAVMRTEPLTVTWTAGTGDAYVNLSQTQSGGPYPATYVHTIRCDVQASAGTFQIPTDLMGALDGGAQANVVVAGTAGQTQDVGDYEVTTRVIVLDVIRMVSVQ